ncbi:MAG: chitobiase/beta-hexosaminidase C-terminal domain-containing protein [Muribaculaceae bacterium]|nr:chitobiase/beta-hexosaminidase C-terminal domain-containing protein [Muribaculaceae bacterium]
MKKLFSLLTLALLTMSAWAETIVTFDLTTGFEDQAELTTLSQGNVTLTFDKGTSNTVPKWYSNGQSARLYAKNTLKIASSGDNITKVTFTFTGTGNTMNNNGTCSVDAGTYVESGTTGTWTGNVDNFTITRGGTSGHARITSIEVVMGGEVVTIVADPVFTPADGATFTDTQEISLTCTTGGATISYSTDGLTWTPYTEPFTINETTKVYAKAALNGVESNVVTATYTKLEPVTGSCVTFKSSEDKGNGTAAQAPWTIVKSGVTMACSKGWVDDNSYRIYQNETLTITSTVGNIVMIEFDGVNNYPISRLSTQTGNLTYNGNNGTWIGEATEVVFTASAQARATEIRVYVDGELPSDYVAAPSIPASQNFDESISVEITNIPEGATAMYNTDGETWIEYTTALTFTETTTLQAKAVKGEKESQVVSATYTKNEPAEVTMTLDEVNNTLGANAEFTYGGNAVVTAQQGAYLWVRDATGYGLIYGKINGVDTLKFNNGQVLNPNWNATKTVYNGLPEYKDAMNVSASANTDTELAAPQEITELSADLINAYVVVKNITSFTVDGRNVTANLSDGTTMVMYNQFNTVITNIPTEEGNYTVYGAVGRYAKNETDQIQLYILNIEGAVTPPEPEAVDVYNFNEAYALTSGTKINMFNDVVVTYQKGNRLWVRDTEGTSGLIYGALNATFNNGDVLSDDWTATYQLFNDNTPEFTNPEGIEASGETREAAPYERTAITTGNVNEYIIMKGLTLLPDADNAKRFYNATDSLVIFNSFNVTIPEVVEGKTYDVTGIVTIYYGEAQVYITEMTENAAPAGLRGDVNNDKVVNISDVTVLIDYLLNPATEINEANANVNLDEAINISDVTVLIDFLLSGTWPNK